MAMWATDFFRYLYFFRDRNTEQTTKHFIYTFCSVIHHHNAFKICNSTICYIYLIISA